jgi:hypothetical protein
VRSGRLCAQVAGPVRHCRPAGLHAGREEDDDGSRAGVASAVNRVVAKGFGSSVRSVGTRVRAGDRVPLIYDGPISVIVD